MKQTKTAGTVLVVDSDAGLRRAICTIFARVGIRTREAETGVEPVTQAEVFGFFKSNLDRVRALLFDVVAAVPEKRSCRCAEAVGPLSD